ncbi:hypothetical protein ACFL02_01735 [Planctomycetota bacterium]
MGRFYYDAKRTVEGALKISVFQLNRWGLFGSSYQEGSFTWTTRSTDRKNSVGYVLQMGERPHIRLMYTTTTPTGEIYNFDYSIMFTSTPCYFGGKRYWFVCPLCSRRAGIVYQTDKFNRFFCRECSNLTYESRNEPKNIRGHPLLVTIDLERKLEQLYLNIKRWKYAGKPTKKARKFRRLERYLDRIPYQSDIY